jgi:hypothetical protein
MSESDESPSAREHESLPPGALGAWWRQGARSAFFLTPSWSDLKTTPMSVFFLMAMAFLLDILLERLYIPGDATFYWQAFAIGWLGPVVSLWVCWIVLPRSRIADDGSHAPGVVALYSMLLAQFPTIQVVLALVFVPLVRTGAFSTQALGGWGRWALWALALAWVLLAQLKVIWNNGAKQRRAVEIGAMLVFAVVLVLSQWVRPIVFWYPDAPASREAAVERFQLTQDVLELQPKLLAEQLQALSPERPGVVDVYAITYSPYADEDVFRRESTMVAGVMAQRFGAEGRTIQLVNHRDTARELAWATPLNLQRTIERMAALMNRDEDILFIHLTSHGAHDGVLSTRHWPLTLDSLTPADLKGWLDKANIRYRIVSVSACYSGSWIAPLANEGTLVMTAADADHTSYGCGKGSELTYFGRAMFNEQLRRTWSFEEAHAAARTAIDEREKAAGKSDGFSNPQIRVGSDIRPQLSRLAAERAAQPAQ